MKEIELSDNFDYKKIIRFTLPNVLSVIFVTIYTMVDGYFVANFVGKHQFAAVNFIIPLFMLVVVIAILLSSGGNAYVAKKLGEGKVEPARQYFSMLCYLIIIIGLLVWAFSKIFLRDILSFFGANSEILEHCIIYANAVMPFIPFLLIQNFSSAFMITNEKPKLVFVSSVISGITNIVLDYIFICRFNLGLAGAGWATAIAACLGGGIPLFVFLLNRKNKLYLGKFIVDFKALKEIIYNGLSEVITQASGSLVMILFNYQIVKYAGNDGIACFGIVNFLFGLFAGGLFGFCSGISPVISYKFGAKNYIDLKELIKKILIIIGINSFVLYIIAGLYGLYFANIFISNSPELLPLTEKALNIGSVVLLVIGFVMFGSSFFTAINDAATSAKIAFLSTFVFDLGCVAVVPIFFGLNGLWASLVVSRFLSTIMCAYYLNKNFYKKYLSADNC